MTDAASNAEIAERLGRRRARVFLVLGLFLVIQQSAYFTHGDGRRLVDHVQIGVLVEQFDILQLFLLQVI